MKHENPNLHLGDVGHTEGKNSPQSQRCPLIIDKPLVSSVKKFLGQFPIDTTPATFLLDILLLLLLLIIIICSTSMSHAQKLNNENHQSPIKEVTVTCTLMTLTLFEHAPMHTSPVGILACDALAIHNQAQRHA
jgi:hypothetical protein